MRAPLLAKLLSAYLVPTLALVVFAPLLAWMLARSSLEAEVGKRLVGSASVAAAQLKPDLLLTLQKGDEQSRTYRNLAARLEGVRVATGASRLYAFTPDRRLLVSTGEAVPIGSPLPELERDRLELEKANAGQGVASSVTFKGSDGHTYKSGYAPVLDDAGHVVALTGADASAEFFDVLRRFGSSMVLLALSFAAAGLGLFFLIGSRVLLAPIRSLVAATNRIGRGDLASPVPSVSKDELGDLARGMDQMRQKLFDREREMQMMLAGIAHEVRNPLGGIELFAGLLSEELSGDAEKLAHVQKITRELNYLKRVVEDFLDFARDPRLSPERIEAKPFLDEIAELVRSDSVARHQQLTVTAGELAFDADPSALRRAVLNLARNAVQATPEGGRIELAAVKEGDVVRLAVRDDGPGVPADIREKLFTPFFTTKEKGLGLGLAFVRRIAEAHGGRAVLEPREKGASFAVELPSGRR